MDLTNITTTDTPDTETESSPPTHANKSLSFTNGAIKRHQPRPPQLPPPPLLPPQMVVSYKECLKNHAAGLGGHALDGCGEFMPSPTATPLDPTSLKCAACGCHRNFHRRDPCEPSTHTHVGHAHGHHLPPPPYRSSSRSTSPNPSSGPPSSPSHPVSSPVPYSYYSSAPHMLLALSTGFSGAFDEPQHHHHHHHPSFDPAVVKTENPNGRKRTRTKFSQDQKDKMCVFAEKLGWKMVKSEEKLVEEFCNESGIGKSVFKVWMHNNKHTLGKRSEKDIYQINSNNNNDNGNGNITRNRVSFDTDAYNINDSYQNEASVHLHISTNGSSSSS